MPKPTSQQIPDKLDRGEAVALIHGAWDTLAQIALSDNLREENTRTAVELGVRAYAAQRRAEAQERREALRAKQVRQAPDAQYIDARDQKEPEAQIIGETKVITARILDKAREMARRLDDRRAAANRGTAERRAWVEELLEFVTEAGK